MPRFAEPGHAGIGGRAPPVCSRCVDAGRIVAVRRFAFGRVLKNNLLLRAMSHGWAAANQARMCFWLSVVSLTPIWSMGEHAGFCYADRFRQRYEGVRGPHGGPRTFRCLRGCRHACDCGRAGVPGWRWRPDSELPSLGQPSQGIVDHASDPQGANLCLPGLVWAADVSRVASLPRRAAPSSAPCVRAACEPCCQTPGRWRASRAG